MVVTATYGSSTTQDVTKHVTYTPETITKAGNVTVSYTENGVTKTATQAVTLDT